jgi:hypothetical protein
MACWKQAVAKAPATHSGARAEPVTVPSADAVAALHLEGTCLPMMYNLDLAVIAAAGGIAILAAVYIWSDDPDRRRRAWRLLKLLLRR